MKSVKDVFGISVGICFQFYFFRHKTVVVCFLQNEAL